MGENTQSQKTNTRGAGGVLREFSAGGVIFNKDLWLIRATSPSDLYPKVYWTLPKGWIDDEHEHDPGPMASGKIKADEDSLKKAALREVAEEGGVDAKIIEKIGTQKFVINHPTRGRILKFVTFYLMKFVKDLPEGFDEETSDVVWLPYPDAYKKLSFSTEKQTLKKANELLQRRGRDSNPR